MSPPRLSGAGAAAALAPSGVEGGDSGCALRLGEWAVEKTGQGVAGDRLRAQSFWLFTAPLAVQRGFPRVHSFEWSPERTRLVMERIAMEPLASAILEGRRDGEAAWAPLEQALQWAHDSLYARWLPSRRPCHRLLVDQVRERTRWTGDTAALHAMVGSPRLLVNGRPLRGLLAALQALSARLDHHAASAALGIDREHLVHGDLHTGNLLVGAAEGFRLIDPRGDFVGGGRYFDRSYDVGKLLHDLHACYNLVRSGRFALEERRFGEYRWRITRDGAWEVYQHLLARLLAWGDRTWGGSDPGWLVRGLLAEGLLLAGLLPFHASKPRRAGALLMAGLVIIDRWIRWADGELALPALVEPVDLPS